MTQSSSLPSNETPLELGIVLYPGMTLLDFAGPQCVHWACTVIRIFYGRRWSQSKPTKESLCFRRRHLRIVAKIMMFRSYLEA